MNAIADARIEGEQFTAHEERGWWPGKTSDPNPTLNGVTQRTYTDWRDHHGLLPRSVQLMEPTEQTAIYDGYWGAGQCANIERLSGALAICHFDCAFNAGAPRAARLLQMTAGLLPEQQDGELGPVTWAALGRAVAATDNGTAMAYLQNRWDFLQRLENFDDWKTVWGGREHRLAALLGLSWTPLS